MAKEKPQLTQEGYQKAQEKLRSLEDKFKEILSRKGEAAEVGGNAWHDNAAFEELTRQEMVIERQINNLKDIIKNAEIVEEGRNRNKVGMGTTVVIEIDGSSPKELTIVDPMRSNPKNNKISQNSPIGKAIMNAKRGETRSFRAGDRERKVKILEIKQI